MASITAKNMNKFLKGKFEEYLMLSGCSESELLHGVNYDTVKAQQSNTNNAINLIIKIDRATSYVQAMSNALNLLTSTFERPYKQIIEDYYFKHHLIRDIAIKLSWSERWINKLKADALKELATRFLVEQVKLRISEDEIINLTGNKELVQQN